MYNTTKKSMLHRLGAFVLALCMSLSLLPAVEREAEAAYSDSAMDELLNWGVISGYPDGSLRPERSLTRAEFVAMTNRAYGYKDVGPTPFTDVPEGSWYHDDIGIAYNANYFTGVSANTALPNGNLTREQAMVLLARNMRLDPVAGEVTDFSDGRDFGQWSRGYARAAEEAGIIGGYPDGSYRPKGDITRGEMAVMLKRALGTLINKPGTHTLSDTYGNVTISSPDTVLKDTTIAGNLYITGGLDLGDISLENVKVLGDIVVAGGGESQSGESIRFVNVEADSLKVDSIADQYVSLAAEGNTLINDVSLRSDAYIQDRTRPGEGFKTINLESTDPNAQFTLSGNLETVVNKTPNSMLKIAMGTVDNLKIDEKATNSTLTLDINSTAKNLSLDTGVKVDGVGDIAKLQVNAAGSNVEMLPDDITIRPGLTADIAGQTMNAKEAQESSSDPRLLAGYPKVKNIAPTSALAVYAANKGGTVYWAVSTTTDGSIPEEELVEPTKDNTRITLNGTTPVESADTEYNATLEKLVADSNYYLSTVFVDARGRHSPVKVASFTTPDDTVPAFSKGYPTVLRNYCESVKISGEEVLSDGTKITTTLTDRDSEQYPKRNYRVQVAAMPNKTCQLYYAVYETGSTAPTAAQFRTGALGKPIRSGVEDATKNRINYIDLTNLEELTNYDIYLCLIDADGARSSKVEKLTFKTVDGKPPRFQYDTPAVTEEQLNGLRLNVNVNEDATVYWVVSKSAEYIKDNIKDGKSEWTEDEWWERACRQIESGTNSVRAGNVRARGNADTVLNITGLEPATSYYVYFVAKDTAGNYSEFFRESHTYNIQTDTTPPKDRTELNVKHNEQPFKYYIQANTLDNVPPTVRQEFTHYDATDHTRPYADTDIKLIFSEEVMQYSANRENTQETLATFKKLYDDMKAKEATKGTDPASDAYKLWKEAQDAYVNALSTTIKLYNASSTGNETVVERNADNDNDTTLKWVIDYRNVEVTVDDDTGELTLFFPGEYSVKKPKTDKDWALNLSSGSTYYFVFDDIADISTSRNRMPRTQLDNFTTVSAQVQLRTINTTSATFDNKSIDMDMAFSMTPISTNVESNVDWDILFWSDSSVTFQIYELDLSSGASRAVGKPVRTCGRPTEPISSYKIVNNNKTINQDVTLDDYTGFEGCSLFRNFYNLPDRNPSVTGEGNVINIDPLTSTFTKEMQDEINKSGIMEANATKYYGIRFTAIGDVSEEDGRGKVWDGTVNFRVSVVTGMSKSLGNLATVISKDTLKQKEDEEGVAQIHSPRPFCMRAQYANSDAPEFRPAYPAISTTDTSLSMTLMLDRPGTVYYVVAPASTQVAVPNGDPRIEHTPTVATTADTAGGAMELLCNETANDANYGRYYLEFGSGEGTNKVYIPHNGSEEIVPLNNNGDTLTGKIVAPGTAGAKNTPRFFLRSPSNSQIYSPNFGNARIKTGNVTLGTGASDPILVEGLDPNTEYLIYYVMQGQGQVYSARAQVYQATTKGISRPELELQRPGTAYATVNSMNMDAIADVALFYMDRYNDGTLSLLKEKFATAALDTSDSSKVSKYNAGNYPADYTVLDALMEQTGRGSVFDEYATDRYKDLVASLIRTNNTSTGRVTGLTLNLKTNQPLPAEFELEPGLTYFVLAVARNAQSTNATGHSLGFGGQQPLFVEDLSLPELESIGGEVLITYQSPPASGGRYKMKGYLDLNFSQPLALYSVASQLHTALTADTFLAGASQSYVVESINTEKKVVRIRFKDNSTGAAYPDYINGNYSINVNPNLSTEFSPNRSPGLVLTPYFDLETYLSGETDKAMKVDVKSSNADEWFPTKSVNINIVDVIMPTASSFDLDKTDFDIEVGKETTLKATLSPDGSSGKIQWAVTSGSQYITVQTVDDLSAKVTGKVITPTSTYATIKATLLDDNGVPTNIFKEVKVRVVPTYVSDIQLSGDNVTYSNGKYTITIPQNTAYVPVKVIVLPLDADDKRVTAAVALGGDVVTADIQFTYTPPDVDGTSHLLYVSRKTVDATGKAILTITASDGGRKFISVDVIAQ